MVATVSLTPTGFCQRRGGTPRQVEWSDVTEIRAVSVGKVTYDESFLLIYALGEVLTVGELDQGFPDFEVSLRSQLSGFPADWYGRAEGAQGAELRLWSRADIG